MIEVRKHLTFITLLLLCSNVASYKILALFPHIARSHYVMGEALLKGLAARGHHVTVVSHFPQKNPIPNFKDISLVGATTVAVEQIQLVNVGTGNIPFTINMLATMAMDVCETTLPAAPIQELMKSQEKYDLIITELFNTDCMFGFVHKFKVPFISIATSVLMPWSSERFANPENPSYIPHHFLGHSDRMTFFERMLNVFYQETTKWAYHKYMDIPTQKIARKYFGESLPPLADIARNTSLLLVNSHFSLNQPRPFVPNIVEVGGMHITPPKPLPQDLKKFLDDSKQGVVYFSFGSMVKMTTLPEEKRQAFMQAFAALPERFLLKWEEESFPGKPENVKLVRWPPQVDVLRHPNVRVFVTHGGLMGTTEAAHSGVPMVAIPLFGDQFVNVASYVEEGIAFKLSFTNITKESVLHALNTVLRDPSYRDNALRVSRAYNDRPMSALDTGIFWTEYVIRHGGAPHMRSAALDLTWYQYLLLDVLAVLISVIATVLLVLFYITKRLIRLVLPSKTQGKKKKQ
ncbi:UDP-glycosyltransferase UGT5-like [Periplaneta americana]|uniref:UDP-glycosyltransferase UGT5-like n=1 Tax=Periplaneta americana TaxID=6978 RepID=UPI0037E7330F